MSFWVTEAERSTCLDALRGAYPGYGVEDHEHQGGCSHTYLLTPRAAAGRGGGELVVQVRPARWRLRVDIARAARGVYGALAPETRAVEVCLPGGLVGCEMGRVRGRALSLLLHGDAVGSDRRAKQRALVASFARLLARSWPGGKAARRRDSVVQPSSPPASATDPGTVLSLCTGKVGSQIAPKLLKLAAALPDERLRSRAQEALESLQRVAAGGYPVVLNHGDLIPSNILVDEETWSITGLVDWAEAEFLPFGMCLYGLEHLLGNLHDVSPPSGGSKRSVWAYNDNAEQLRQLFYDTLTSLVPELKHRRAELWLMRDIGVFLWHGYAWDDGAIDRVVDEVRDGGELAKLRAMLRVSLQPVRGPSADERNRT